MDYTFPHLQLRLDNHQHYVQGVTWDPLGHTVVTQSADRTCKVGLQGCGCSVKLSFQ